MTPEQLADIKTKWELQDERVRLAKALRRQLRSDLGLGVTTSDSAIMGMTASDILTKTISRHAYLNFCMHERERGERRKAAWKKERRQERAQARVAREAVLYAAQCLRRAEEIRAKLDQKREVTRLDNAAQRLRFKLDEPVIYDDLFEMQARSMPCSTEFEHTLRGVQLLWTPFHEMTPGSALLEEYPSSEDEYRRLKIL